MSRAFSLAHGKGLDMFLVMNIKEKRNCAGKLKHRLVLLQWMLEVGYSRKDGFKIFTLDEKESFPPSSSRKMQVLRI